MKNYRDIIGKRLSEWGRYFNLSLNIFQKRRLSNMQWQELCEKAKEMGYIHCSYDYKYCEELYGNGLCFCENGEIKTTYMGEFVSKNKSVEQMYQIMKALQ